MNPPPPSESDGHKKKVLLVDDNLDVQTVVSIGLEHLGFDVIKCSTGQEALDQFAAEGADVAIIDQGLPDIKGVEVGQQIRLVAAKPITIALLTGSDSPALRDEAKLAGFNGFLLKPLRIQTLAEWINQHSI